MLDVPTTTCIDVRVNDYCFNAARSIVSTVPTETRHLTFEFSKDDRIRIISFVSVNFIFIPRAHLYLRSINPCDALCAEWRVVFEIHVFISAVSFFFFTNIFAVIRFFLYYVFFCTKIGFFHRKYLYPNTTTRRCPTSDGSVKFWKSRSDRYFLRRTWTGTSSLRVETCLGKYSIAEHTITNGACMTVSDVSTSRKTYAKTNRIFRTEMQRHFVTAGIGYFWCFFSVFRIQTNLDFLFLYCKYS